MTIAAASRAQVVATAPSLPDRIDSASAASREVLVRRGVAPLGLISTAVSAVLT